MPQTSLSAEAAAYTANVKGNHVQTKHAGLNPKTNTDMQVSTPKAIPIYVKL